MFTLSFDLSTNQSSDILQQREDSQIEFFPRNVPWTFDFEGEGGFTLWRFSDP